MRDKGLVGTVTMTSDLGIAEDRWQVGVCDLGKDQRSKTGDRVGKFLEVTLPQS